MFMKQLFQSQSLVKTKNYLNVHTAPEPFTLLTFCVNHPKRKYIQKG